MPSLSCRKPTRRNEASGGFSSRTESLSRRLEGSLAQALFLPSRTRNACVRIHRDDRDFLGAASLRISVNPFEPCAAVNGVVLYWELFADLLRYYKENTMSVPPRLV